MEKKEKIRDWYNERYRQGRGESWRPYEAYRIYVDLLGVREGQNFMDVACGTGHLLKQAAERGAKTFGVDISSEAVDISQNNSPTSEINVSSGESLNYPNEFFDRLTCIGALEHFSDIDKGLSEFYRITQKDALLCFVLPNSQYFYWLLRQKKGTDQSGIKEKLATLDEWSSLLQGSGYDIVKVLQDTWVFRKFRLFKPLNPVKIVCKILSRLFYRLIPLKYTYQFIFILKKK